MEDGNRLIEVPLWQLRDIENTLRIAANTLNSKRRETCLDRNIMKSWNEVVDIINNKKATIGESISYYMKKNQEPNQ